MPGRQNHYVMASIPSRVELVVTFPPPRLDLDQDLGVWMDWTDRFVKWHILISWRVQMDKMSAANQVRVRSRSSLGKLSRQQQTWRANSYRVIAFIKLKEKSISIYLLTHVCPSVSIDADAADEDMFCQISRANGQQNTTYIGLQADSQPERKEKES